MKRFSRTRRHWLAAACCAAALGLPLAAAAYPDKTVRIIVPYAPGGSGDVFARLIAERLTARLGQTFIVENRPGASGAIGARYVADAPADGSVLLLGQTGEIVVTPLLSRTLNYKPENLVPIVLVGDSPLVLSAHPSAPFNTVQEMVAQSKQRSQGFNYASSGTGTPGHLAAAALALKTGAKLTHVPYKGGGAALSDLLGNHVDMFFSGAPGVLPHFKSGTLKPIAVSTLERSPALPQVPTVAESGLPGFSFSLWGGLFAPRGTPAEVIDALNREVNAILADGETRGRLEAEGAVVKQNSVEQFTQFLGAERARYQEIIKETGVRLD
ncbi:Bug family tripartite tricarboxylate transporter substrate binding protein [Bordetella genomosp. 9]|uniref:ABC transporter substrate-binding protein n=1 Tax=Bordetella genomosp. 9 TaxID=1416803 RepID=A0A1W6Z2D1_9BORD|nr:tripartite tricarboxylate transporter substrate binding protein [Bordetella genomosp. 9]ARP87269.1 ABC transporter substrate-binding protein [Bordetella genomosp. 9]